MNICLAGLWQTYTNGYILDFWKACPALFTFPVLTGAAYNEPAEGSTLLILATKQAGVFMLLNL